MRAYALRIVSTENILCFMNTLVIIFYYIVLNQAKSPILSADAGQCNKQ